jgi:ubiquitin-like protein Nedd8
MHFWSLLIVEVGRLTRVCNRVDDKTAADYQLEGGATLHLVLALRGGRFVVDIPYIRMME